MYSVPSPVVTWPLALVWFILLFLAKAEEVCYHFVTRSLAKNMSNVSHANTGTILNPEKISKAKILKRLSYLSYKKVVDMYFNIF